VFIRTRLYSDYYSPPHRDPVKRHARAVSGVWEPTKTNPRRLRFRSVRSLVQAIMGYLEHHNKNPQPFQWTAEADLILERVAKGV
jgi:hypothetical protein